jgi:hypothetical protein
MNFFDVLFWMGMLCLIPVIFVVVRDATSTSRRSSGMSAPGSPSREGGAMPSDLAAARLSLLPD